MTQRKLKKQLRQYAAECKMLIPKEKEKQIVSLLQAESRVQTKALLQEKAPYKTRGSAVSFVLEQIGYLGKYCLVWQIAWIVLFCYLMRHSVGYFFGEADGNGVLVMISLLPPLLVLLTVETITKVYQRSMLEIEYATKYSLLEVVIVRMLFLGVFHCVILAVEIIVLHKGLESDAGKLLIYGFTPMIMITGVLLKIMQYCQGEQLRSAGIGVYLGTVILTVMGNTKYFGWYEPFYFKVWCAVCVLGVFWSGYQFVCLCRKLATFEKAAFNFGG